MESCVVAVAVAGALNSCLASQLLLLAHPLLTAHLLLHIDDIQNDLHSCRR
jgi:hypothetical protein